MQSSLSQLNNELIILFINNQSWLLNDQECAYICLLEASYEVILDIQGVAKGVPVSCLVDQLDHSCRSIECKGFVNDKPGNVEMSSVIIEWNSLESKDCSKILFWSSIWVLASTISQGLKAGILAMQSR